MVLVLVLVLDVGFPFHLWSVSCSPRDVSVFSSSLAVNSRTEESGSSRRRGRVLRSTKKKMRKKARGVSSTKKKKKFKGEHRTKGLLKAERRRKVREGGEGIIEKDEEREDDQAMMVK